MKDKWKPDLVKVNREKKVAGELVGVVVFGVTPMQGSGLSVTLEGENSASVNICGLKG